MKKAYFVVSVIEFLLNFQPDGNILAFGSKDITICLQDVKTKKIAKLEGHDDSVPSICFSPDGNILASGSNNKSIRLWDGITGLKFNPQIRDILKFLKKFKISLLYAFIIRQIKYQQSLYIQNFNFYKLQELLFKREGLLIFKASDLIKIFQQKSVQKWQMIIFSTLFIYLKCHLILTVDEFICLMRSTLVVKLQQWPSPSSQVVNMEQNMHTARPPFQLGAKQFKLYDMGQTNLQN